MKQPVVHIRAFTHGELLRLAQDDQNALTGWLEDQFTDATATAGVATHEYVVYTVQALMPPAKPTDPVDLEDVESHRHFLLPPGCDARRFNHPCNIADEEMREAAYDLWSDAFNLDVDQDVWAKGVAFKVLRYGHTNDHGEWDDQRTNPEDAAASGAPYDGRVWLRRIGYPIEPRSVALEHLRPLPPVFYGQYLIMESFATNADEMVILGYAPERGDAWVTAVYKDGGDGHGTYYRKGGDARRDYAKRIAHSLGLQVASRQHVMIHPKNAKILAANATALREMAEAVQLDPSGAVAFANTVETVACDWQATINGEPFPPEEIKAEGTPVGMNTAEFISAVHGGANFNREGN